MDPGNGLIRLKNLTSLPRQKSEVDCNPLI